VVDWGLAKALRQRAEDAPRDEHTLIPSSGSGSSETLPGSAIGTPAYMSPEQSEGRIEHIGPASDVYSLGATLYTILTGKEPFESSTIGVILGRVQSGDFVPPRERHPAVPRALNAICLKAMSLSPKDRYQSCAALAGDIEHWLADEPVTALRDPLSDRTIRWIKRHRALAATSTALMTAAMIGLLAGTALLGKANREIQIAAAEARTQRDTATQQRAVAETERRRADASAAQADDRRKEAVESARQAKQESEHVNWLLYSRDIADAQHDWDSNDIEVAWNRLNSCREDFRGWEHRYLCTLFTKNQRTFVGHTGPVLSVAFSPDGKQIASGSNDTTVKVWDASTGQEIRTLKGHTNTVYSVAFSPDGKQIISGSNDGTIEMWDASSGRVTLTLKGHTSGLASVAISRDGKRIASGSGHKTVKVWDASTGQETLALKGDAVKDFRRRFER
jgi:hypothetical protein